MHENIVFITMEKDVNLMLATYGKYFPETSLPQVREIFEQMDDTQAATLSCTQFKDPITSIILSVLLGQFGADRFYLEQIGIGTYLRWIGRMDAYRPVPYHGCDTAV